MKTRTEEIPTTTTIYFMCERCGREHKDTSKPIMQCPEHGEFCNYCARATAEYFPFVVCPVCKITSTELHESAHYIGPNNQFDHIDLPQQYIVIRKDTTGCWIAMKSKEMREITWGKLRWHFPILRLFEWAFLLGIYVEDIRKYGRSHYPHREVLAERVANKLEIWRMKRDENETNEV